MSAETAASGQYALVNPSAGKVVLSPRGVIGAFYWPQPGTGSRRMRLLRSTQTAACAPTRKILLAAPG
jgi:hypothetical protein